VVIGDDQLHTAQPPGPQALEERRPEGTVLAVAHLDTQHLPVAVGGDAGGDDDGTRDHPAPHAALDVGAIREDVGKADMAEWAVAELLELGVEAGADPAHLALGDPRAHPQRLDQVVDLAGRHPVDIGLHDHGEQSPVDAAAPLQKAGEERALPQLGDGQLHVAGWRRQQPRAVAVALSGAALAAFVALGADPGTGLGLDELLQYPLQAGADGVGHLAGLESGEQFGQVMIGEGHRWVLLLRVPAKNTSKIPPVAHQVVDPYVDLHHVTGRPPALLHQRSSTSALRHFREHGLHVGQG